MIFPGTLYGFVIRTNIIPDERLVVLVEMVGFWSRLAKAQYSPPYFKEGIKGWFCEAKRACADL